MNRESSTIGRPTQEWKLIVSVGLSLLCTSLGWTQIPSTLGWYQIPKTTIQAVAPDPAQYPNIQGVEGPSAVTADWNGAVADTTRNRLIVWGGGHNGYYGNEVYALDLNTLKLTRLNDPTANPVLCASANGDGTANVRHTYGGLAYLPTTDQMMAFNGSLACPGGFGPNPLDTWMFNFGNLTWQPVSINGITQGPGNFGGTHYDYLTVGNDAEYDPNTGLVFAKDGGSIYSYNPITKTWATLLGYGSDYNISSALDTKRKIFLLMGNGQAHKIDVSNPANVTGSAFTPTGCGPVFTSVAPGLAYDPVQDRVVGWAGGNTVYLLNLDADSCTTVTYSGGPPAQQPNGTWGRFRYFPNLGVFALVNDWAQNAYALRLTSGTPPPTPEADFAARCAAPGVIACEGFDNASEFVPATFPNTGLYPSGPSAYIVQDTTMYASGGGSLHFPMTANGAPVQNDNWLQNFCSAHPPASCTPPSFTQNSDFYIQFRYRVDSGYLQNWETCCGSSPKIFDVANHQSSCGQTELTIVDRNGTGLQSGYGNCGGYGFDVWPATGLFKGLSAPSYPLNFQSGYYNCEETPAGNVPHPPGGCFTMPANTWMTFYEHVHIGTYNQSNSVFELWVGTAAGQPLQYLIKIPDFIMPPADTSGYDAIWFNVFMTGFRGNNQAANAWLDEVIVSTQPIAAPGGTPPPPPPAPVITSALAASGTVGLFFSYRIAASNSPTSFNATGLPAGLSINASNGLISGTPTAAGTSNIAISATNAGGAGSATLVLTINAAPDTIPPTPPPADAKPGLRDTLVFPNPAVSRNPTIRTFLGQVSSVEITIFDAAGEVVNSASLGGSPTGISNGQYYYDYIWSGKKSSGIYFAVIHGKAADGSIVRARTKFAIVR